jgi:two-component system invasion response regulator UvrY
MIRILIADDHTIVREGLKQILAETSDIVVSAEASTGQDVLRKVRAQNFDLILLDISLPGISGLDVLKQIKSLKPGLPVLILSMYPEEQYAVRTLRAGASGYLTKESASSELIRAIREVALGKKYITMSLAEKIALSWDTQMTKPLHEALSDREYQVLCLIASGKTVKEVSRLLSLSVKTVSTHRSRILKKMDMRNNSQLTHYAIKHNLIE